MIRFLRRVLVTALTPPDAPADAPVVTVRGHTRRPPVNAKREALHEALRRSVKP